MHTSKAAQDKNELDLIYKINSSSNELDVFELARVLDSFGNVLKEAYRVSFPQEGELAVRVKPFERGSFIVDLGLFIQQNPALLFVLSYKEAIDRTKQVLEYLGLAKSVRETGLSLMGLLRGLRNGKPESVEQKGQDTYEYRASDGAVLPVNSTVHALYNSPVINHYTFNIVAPVEHESVQSILTYLKQDQKGSQVELDKEDAEAVRAFSFPPELENKSEILEDTTTKLLRPKSGNYGQTTGTWSFTIAGSNRVIKARITDKAFLRRYASGSIRFYQGDTLKVKLLERQVVEGSATKLEYEIVKVLDYSPARQAVRVTQTIKH